MKTEEISDRMIRDLLLGSLDESTTERLDELSITSAEFADRIAVERYELIDGFVAGRLDAEERKRFEVVLARSPAMRASVEVGTMLAAAGPKAVVVERLKEPSFFAGLFAGWPRFAYGIGGLAVILGIIGFGLFILRRGPDPEISRVDLPVSASPTASAILVTPTAEPLNPVLAEDPLPTQTPANVERPTPSPTATLRRSSLFTAIVLAPPMRGGSDTRSVRLEEEVEFLHLTLQTEATSTGRFAIEIGDPSGATDWRSPVLRGRSANGRTSVFVRVPASRLKNGVRSIRLLDAGSGAEVLDEHAIRIVR